MLASRLATEVLLLRRRAGEGAPWLFPDSIRRDHVALWSGLAAPEVQAFTVNLEFDTDGVLPSEEPDIAYFSSHGPLIEADVFSVWGGLLQQRQSGLSGRGLYHSPETTSAPGPFDTAFALRAEFRARVIAIQDNPRPFGKGGEFLIADGETVYAIGFVPDAVTFLRDDSGTVVRTPLPLDISQFHTYEIRSAGADATYTLLVDGSPIFSGIGPTTAIATFQENGYRFGNFIFEEGGADIEWDFIRITQIPEPSVAFLIGLGLVVIAVVRQRGLAT